MKGMLDCLGDMKLVMTKLHDKQNVKENFAFRL